MRSKYSARGMVSTLAASVSASVMGAPVCLCSYVCISAFLTFRPRLFPPSGCRAHVRGRLTFTHAAPLAFKPNITPSKINRRHWPGLGACSTTPLPLSLPLLGLFCLSLSWSGVLFFSLARTLVGMKPGVHLWRQQGERVTKWKNETQRCA